MVCSMFKNYISQGVYAIGLASARTVLVHHWQPSRLCAAAVPACDTRPHPWSCSCQGRHKKRSRRQCLDILIQTLTKRGT